MNEVVEQLKKRRVFRVAAAYVVIAWGAVQVVLTVAPEFGFADWVGRAAILLGIAGFPVVVAFAWAFDLSPRGVRRGRVSVAGAITVIALASLVLFLRSGSDDEVTAEEVATLVAEARIHETEGRYVEAWTLALRADSMLPDDDSVAALLTDVSDPVEILSDPPGATVRAAAWTAGTERPDERPDARLRTLGVTPLTDLRLPRALHHLRFELDGHRTVERPFSLVDWDEVTIPGAEGSGPPRISVDLEAEGRTPDDMVRVPGGTYTIASPDLPPGLTATLDEFLIGRYEVTNADYAEFVLAGGYTDARYWEHDFVSADGVLGFDDAMARLVDRTGLPGPRAWSGQAFPPEEADHPVTGVTWFEAAAYARYRDAGLPTAYQWEKAARDGRHTWGESILMPWGPSRGWDRSLANFGGRGTDPVDAHPFGISPWGAYDMAGNVAEWLANPSGEGRTVTGGAWDAPMHVFSEFSGFDPFYASSSLGFRLVFLESGRRRLSRDQGTEQLGEAPVVPSYPTLDTETVATLKSHYQYDPVDPEGSMDDEIDDGRWIRQEVSFQGSFGDRIAGYLYLPKSVPPPWQTLLYVPSGSALGGTTVPEDAEWVMAPVVQSGRAVFTVEISGMVGNRWPEGWTSPDPPSVRFRNELVQNAIELRNGIDYLETRDDIDMERFGYAAFSYGAGSRGAFLSVDDRYRVGVLMGAGIDERVRPVLPEVDPVTFAPHLEIPVLIIQGRHDEEHPYFTRFLPLYELMPESTTTLELVPGGGHLVRPEIRLPVTTEFLDEHFGPVMR